MTLKQLTASLFLSLMVLTTAAAQEENAPRFEVGAHFSSITLIEPTQHLFIRPATCDVSRTKAGVGGRFTYNFTNSIAGEADITFFPQDDGCPDDYTRGRTLQGVFGVKSGKRFKKFGIYGKARPGFIRFGGAFSGTRSETVNQQATFVETFGRTNFALDVGGVVEFYPSRRITTRFDVGDTIIHYRELTFGINPVCPANPALPCITTGVMPGATQHNFQFSAGVGYRF